MKTEHTDTIVLGLGAMGSSALAHLARRGERAVGIDQFDINHTRGSSHGFSRIIRQSYFEHPDYVPLLKRAYELWAELERASGARLLHVTGGLLMGSPGSEVVEGSVRAAELHGLAHERLDHAALAARFPAFRLPEHWIGMHEPSAGMLLPERVIAAQVELALRHGAAVRVNERVEQWVSDGSNVEVRTSSSVYRAKRLVITAGAWAGGVIHHPTVRIEPTRQVLGWVWPRRPELFAMGRLPVWALDVPSDPSGEVDGGEVGGMYYGFPMMPTSEAGMGGPPGFKLARHVRGVGIDPDSPDRSPRPQDEADFRSGLSRYLPDADGPLVAMRVCVYENSPDSHFIIDRHPDYPNVAVAAGFSGHGFKFASVVGEIMADLTTEGNTPLPIGFLSAARFPGGASGGAV